MEDVKQAAERLLNEPFAVEGHGWWPSGEDIKTVARAARASAVEIEALKAALADLARAIERGVEGKPTDLAGALVRAHKLLAPSTDRPEPST